MPQHGLKLNTYPVAYTLVRRGGIEPPYRPHQERALPLDERRMMVRAGSQGVSKTPYTLLRPSNPRVGAGAVSRNRTGTPNLASSDPTFGP